MAVPRNDDIVLIRYNSNGSLDSAFGNNGVVITDFFGRLDGGNFLLLKPDGKIIVILEKLVQVKQLKIF